MSCFICNDETISAAVDFITDNEVFRNSELTDRKELFKILKRFNYEAVAERYNEEIDEELSSWGEYKPQAVSIYQQLKAAKCLDYQNSDSTSYRNSIIYRRLGEAFGEYKFMEKLEAYKAAGWGL